MNIDPMIPAKIAKLENQLGIKLYLVGGAVRDTLLGVNPKDLDFITPSLPEEIENAIINLGKKPILIGKKFGTLKFKYVFEDETEQLIEITTFRTETYQDQNRKPEVFFTDNIQIDLGRRDFSINAIAIDSNGKLIDIFNGQNDLKNGIIKAVGNPKIRFTEDPLRLLRAIRLAQKLNFEIEPVTLQKITECKYQLYSISKERWVAELDQMLSGDNVRKGLNLLMDTGLLGVMLPEMVIQKNYDQNNPYHDFTLWEHTLNVVEGVPKSELNLRWAALLHDIAKPFTRIEKPNGYFGFHGHEIVGAQMSLKISQYLKFSKTRTEFIFEIIKHHLEMDCPLKKYDDGGKKLKQPF
jgi:putative nucleotidyltransferase with HDIG domain